LTSILFFNVSILLLNVFVLKAAPAQLCFEERGDRCEEAVQM